MYRVISDFYDLTDSTQTKDGLVFYLYKTGDSFPRLGKSVDSARIDELSSNNNKLGRPLIVEVEDKEAQKWQYLTT